MGIRRETFYDKNRMAIVPMGFCYPGRGKSGDLPPRKECATNWRQPVLSELKNIQLTLAIGQYAIAYHLPECKGKLTETVRNWDHAHSSIIPLPHPSPRNNIWLKRNPWFEEDVIPCIKARVSEILLQKESTLPVVHSGDHDF